MSNYKLTFKLKQHTPIIHFQYDQTGATLRATELKPKLDRFLIDKMGGLLAFDKYKNFLIGDYKEIEQGLKKIDDKNNLTEEQKNKQKEEFLKKQHLALDYKVRVEGIGENKIFLPLPLYQNNTKQNLIKNFLNHCFDDFIMPSPFFANADKIKIKKDKNDNFYIKQNESKPEEIIYAIMQDNIKGEIKCFNTVLLKEIENSLEYFFLTHNFGTRQNKGFGSFTVKEINGNTKNITTAQLQKHFIKESNNSYTSFNDIFKFILDEYNLLKSGINIPFGVNPKYEKSELFKYFIKEGIRWEKRFIKQKLIANGKPLKKKYAPIDYDDTKTPINVNNVNNYYNSVNDKQTNNYAYIRALLGLAEHFEYQLHPNGRLKVKIVSTNNNKIERFQSPIFFKVIDNTVYLGINDSYKQIEGEEFEFLLNNNSIGKLKVPQNFNLRDFINNHISNNW